MRKVIEVRNLYKLYRVGDEFVRALDGVDFEIYEGEFCAIVGTSGSGKSTLLNMLAGLEKPTKGEVIIAGTHIEKLNEEKALNGSLGFTATFGDFTATVDGYLINVKDRIVLTGYFDASSFNLGVDEAQFFVNGVDTKTTGLDVVLSWKKKINDNSFSASLVGNINNMKIDKVKNGSLDKEIFFGEREKAFLLASAPDNKFGLNLNYDRKWFNAGLAFTRFSEVKLLDYQMYEDVAGYGSFAEQIKAATDTYGAKIVTDLTLGFQLQKHTKLSIGANNLFNIYPDQQDDWVEAGGYWDAVQMGFSGAYYYARLGFNF